MARNDLEWRPTMFLAKISISVCTCSNILCAICFATDRNDMSVYTLEKLGGIGYIIGRSCDRGMDPPIGS